MQILKKNKSFLLYLIVAAVILIFSQILFGRYIFGGEHYIFDEISNDTIRINYPTYYMYGEYLQHGFTWWSMRMGLGTSILSHGDIMFDPFTYIVYLFGTNGIGYMIVWMIIVKLVCAGLSFCAYIRHFKVSFWPALLSSIAYAFAGYGLVMGRNYVFSTVVVYLPLILLSIEIMLEKRKWLPLIGILFLTCIYFYYMFYIVGIICILYLVFRCAMKKISFWYTCANLLKLASIGIIVILLSAIVTIPQLYIAINNLRVSESSVSLGQLFDPSFKALFTAFLRMFSYNGLGAIDGNYVGYNNDYFELVTYSSVLAVFSLGLLLFSSDLRQRRWTIIIAAVVALMIAFPLVSYVFNGFSTFSYRWSFVINLLLAVCIAFGLENIFVQNHDELPKWLLSKKLFLCTMATCIVGVSLLLALSVAGVVRLSFSMIIAKYGLIGIGMPVLVLCIYILLPYIWVLTQRQKQNEMKMYKKKQRKNQTQVKNHGRLASCMFVLLLLEIFVTNLNWMNESRTYDPGDLKTQTGFFDESYNIIQKLKSNDNSFYRLDKDYDSVFVRVNAIRSDTYQSDNDPMVQGYYGLESYNSNNNPSYIKFLQALGVWVCFPTSVETFAASGISPSDLHDANLNYINGVYDRYKLMALLGVKYYVVSKTETKVPDYFTLKEDGAVKTYYNEAYYPLAFSNSNLMYYEDFMKLSTEEKDEAILHYIVVDQSELGDMGISTIKANPGYLSNKTIPEIAEEQRNNTEILSFNEDKISLKATVIEDESITAFSIPYDKGWKVVCDGRIVDTYNVDLGLLGIRIDAGEHMLELRYMPTGIAAGCFITIGSLLLIILCVALSLLLKKGVVRCPFFLLRLSKKDNYPDGWVGYLEEKHPVKIRGKLYAFIRQKLYIGKKGDWKLIKPEKIPILSQKDNPQKEQKGPRNTNLELCRIICMLLIIAHHVVVHGGGISIDFSTNKIISLFILPGGKLAFDCFIALSCWFLVEQVFRTERFLKIWLETLFYSITFAVVAYLMGTEFTNRNWFSIIFPIAGNSHGFAAAYLSLYLLLPFLAKISKNITKKQAGMLVVILFFLEVMTQLIGAVSQYTQPLSSELLIFILLYFVAFYLKRFPIKILSNKAFTFSIFILCWITVFLLNWLSAYYPTNPYIANAMMLGNNESSILYIIGGFSLFFFFYNIKMPTVPFINKLATTTLGILLIHDHNFFRYDLWKKIVRTQDWYYINPVLFVLSIVVTAICIFVLGAIIDLLRQKLLEKPIFRAEQLQMIIKRVDTITQESSPQISKHDPKK